MKDVFKPVENLRTIRNNYILTEIKDGFDKFNLGDTDIEIEMRPRTGVAKYTNFSKRCKVLLNPEGGKYAIGASVWVAHVIKDTLMDGGGIHEDFGGMDVMYCHEDNIMFECDDLTQLESDEWIIMQSKVMEQKEKDGLILVSDYDDLIGHVVTGALNKGDEITWWERVPRVELWQKEVQYWAVHIDTITSINGEPHKDFYKVHTFDDDEVEYRGMLLRGTQAKMVELGIERMKGCIIARLENPSLEHHGCTCLVRKPKRKSLIHHSEVHAILSTS